MMKICPECLERVDADLDYCPEDGTELREIHAREEDPMEGRVLEEKWLLESRIGGGGMGTVYKAHQLTVDRTVAVKVLRSDLSEDDEHVQRFFREANVASKVSDPRCVTIFDFGQSAEDHVLYIAMEYLDGEPLHDHLSAGKFTIAETVEIGIQIAAALETLHGQGVVHRDLKPENVFLVDEVGEDVFLKLLDFGLAKVAQSDATPVTASGQVFGTPAFMSPEQCMGSDVGPRSDLYSLGCLLYELVSGQTPFQSNVSVEVLLAHVNRPPPALTGEGVLPRGYRKLIMELLEKDPADRPESSVEVRERLEAIREELGDAEDDVVAPELVAVGDEADPDTRETMVRGGEEPPRDLVPDDEEREVRADVDTLEVDEPRRSNRRGGLVLTGVVAGAVGVLIAAYWNGLLGAAESTSRAPAAAPAEVRSAVDAAHSVRSEALDRADAAAGATHRAKSSSERALFLAGARTFRTSTTPGAAAEGGAEPTGAPDGRAAAGDRPERNSPGAGAGGEAGGAKRTGAADERESGEPGDSKSPGAGEPTGDDGADESERAAVPFLTKESARRVFESKSSTVVTCIENELGAGVSSTISVRVEVIVGQNGDVQSADVSTEGFESKAVRTCVGDRARAFSFPPTGSGRRMRIAHVYRYLPQNLDL